MADKGKKEPKTTTPQTQCGCGCGCLPVKKQRRQKQGGGTEGAFGPPLEPRLFLVLSNKMDYC